MVSLNRKSDPNICFVKGNGSLVEDIDGNSYIDYQAGFAASFLGHNDPDVNAAVAAQLDQGTIYSLSHALESEVAELICSLVPSADASQGENGAPAVEPASGS